MGTVGVPKVAKRDEFNSPAKPYYPRQEPSHPLPWGEPYTGKAYAEPGLLGDDPQITGQGVFQTTADSVSVDHGNGGLFHLNQSKDHPSVRCLKKSPLASA